MACDLIIPKISIVLRFVWTIFRRIQVCDEVDPCMCCEVKLKVAEVNAPPWVWSAGNPRSAPMLPLNVRCSAVMGGIAWQEINWRPLNLGNCSSKYAGNIEKMGAMSEISSMVLMTGPLKLKFRDLERGM